MKSSKLTRGFLFTISSILFASTLVFFAMNFADVSASSEYLVASSARPLGTIFLSDNVAFNLFKVLNLNVDVNDSINQVVLFGTLSTSFNEQNNLLNYASFLENNYFPLTPGSESIDLNSLVDGSAEVFLGSSAEADYNYNSSSISLFALNSSQFTSIDLNIRAKGDLNFLDVNTTVGDLIVNILYVDDSNTFSLTKSISSSELNTITLGYLDSNSIISIGKTNGVNDFVSIGASSDHNISYVIKAIYSTDSVLLPTRINSKMVSISKDYNVVSTLVLQK
ncbi:MAG: hypothetical protein WCW44_01475 [archaeon]|jgi:hypothetical protein